MSGGEAQAQAHERANESAWFARLKRLTGSDEADPRRGRYRMARWVFVRGMGLIYLVAIISWWVQLEGLVGDAGIEPASAFLDRVENHFGSRWEGFWRVPTLAWLSPGSDAILHWLCGLGVAAALAVAAGFFTGPLLLLLWMIYLSLATTGGIFMGYQWDALLLETGFLAPLLAPWKRYARRDDPEEPSRWAVFLLRWLLFRLMFFSGWVKLASGDGSWADGTALEFHYETQPLPTWVAWYAHQLPGWFQWCSVKIMFGIELGLPFFVFLGRRPRAIAFLGFAFLNILIAITGNYTYFNYVTVLLAILLLDDSWWPRRWLGIPAGTNPLANARGIDPVINRGRRWCGDGLRYLAGGLVFLLSLTVVMKQVSGGRVRLPGWVDAVSREASAFRSVNGYGLFAVMTTTRPEIVVEGSRDGITWLAYRFRWKPGALDHRPRFVAPHQPRLDWQMWFAALRGRYDPASGDWFGAFLVRLFENSPPVLNLLEENPFAEEPPRYLRARLYRYEFTDGATRKRSGEWWQRTYLHEFCPAITLGK